MEKLRQRALELALQGLRAGEVLNALSKEYQGETASATELLAATRHVFYGEEMQQPAPLLPENGEDAAIKAYNKRRVRKAMIMLKVNYKNADADAVCDCIADLLHYCNAKGIDYTEAEERGRMHFNAELVGGEHG